MSVWTEVCGCIRVDNVERERTLLEFILGPVVFHNSPSKTWNTSRLPCGSEGSLRYLVIDTGNHITHEIMFFGCLRDYDDSYFILKWWTDLKKQLEEYKYEIRQAVLKADCEGKFSIVLG